jgi:hypothetical protein
LVHVHQRTYLWQFDLPLLVLALFGLAVLYPFARLPRRGQRAFGAAAAAGLLALSVTAFAAGINPQPGPGTYKREPPEIERSDGFLGTGPETITKRIRLDHYHEPIDLAAHWLLLGLGLAALAIPGARVAVASRSKPAASPTEGAAT